MAISDYNPSASLNTTLSGIYTGPNMARSDVDNSIRQLMADMAGSYVPIISVNQTGAVGDGITDDTAAFVAATAAGFPAYVPAVPSFYVTTGLTNAQKELLYGPGIVKDGSAYLHFPSAPQVPATTAAGATIIKQNMQPVQYAGIQGSLGTGFAYMAGKRTGGFGSYGLLLVTASVSASTPAAEFDVGITSWITHQNLNNGSVFGAWFGSNTPSSALSQTMAASSAAIGVEVNVGNRWSDPGLQIDVGLGRYTVGLQVVPDVVPADDGVTVAIYPGSFAIMIGQSVTGHKWWVGTLVRTDTIMPGGYVNVLNGGSTAPNAPAALSKVEGFFGNGIDFSAATFSGQAIKAANILGQTAFTVATLPSAATSYMRAFVSDANATTFNSIVAGGGANRVPVFSDGTNWRIG